MRKAKLNTIDKVKDIKKNSNSTRPWEKANNIKRKFKGKFVLTAVKG